MCLTSQSRSVNYVVKGQVCARDKQKQAYLDEEYRAKKNADAKTYYQEHKFEISEKKKEIYNRRMATLMSTSPRHDWGCYTDKQNAGDPV